MARVRLPSISASQLVLEILSCRAKEKRMRGLQDFRVFRGKKRLVKFTVTIVACNSPCQAHLKGCSQLALLISAFKL